jgi:hypothetical protein
MDLLSEDLPTNSRLLVQPTQRQATRWRLRFINVLHGQLRTKSQGLQSPWLRRTVAATALAAVRPLIRVHLLPVRRSGCRPRLVSPELGESGSIRGSLLMENELSCLDFGSNTIARHELSFQQR